MQKDSRGFSPTGWDVVGIVAGFLFTIVVTVVLSRGRIFWEDEMLGWMLLRDASWHHMIYAWRAGADGGGFCFYLTARAWMSLVGASTLSFRLYSSTCFGLAFAATWASARRYYSAGIVAFALFNTWFFSPPFILHMREGRFYGLLTLSVSLAIWAGLIAADVQGRTPKLLYASTFAVHSLLTTSHLLGVVFSAVVLSAIIISDLQRKRWRPFLYACAASSWLLLLAERSNIVASARVGKPYFWVRPPKLVDVFHAYSGWSSEIAVVLGVLVCAAAWALVRSQRGWRLQLRRSYAHRTAVYLMIGVFLFVPLAFLFEGSVATWLFTERYLLPVNIALAYLTAELSQLILSSDATAGLLRRNAFFWRVAHGTAIVLFALALLFWDLHHVKEFSPTATDYVAGLDAQMPRGLPIVCEDAFTFTEVVGRKHPPGIHYFFLLDWHQTISSSAPRLEVTQYHLMQNWKAVGYFSDSIQPVDEFLRQNPVFLVVHAGPKAPTGPAEIGNPLAARFLSDPAYEVRKQAVLDRRNTEDTIWLVCRGRCPTH